MTGPVNKAKRSREMHEQNRRMAVKLLPLQEEKELSPDTPSDLADAPRIDEFPTLELSAVDVDQLPTYVGLPVILMSSSWSSPLTDGISINDRPTWLLPIIPGSGKASSQISPSEMQTAGGASYLGLIRNLVKNSGIYAIASLTAPLVTLLLAPFLTHTLSRTDYGALAVLNTVVALVAGVAELGLTAASGRLYVYDSKTRREQLDTLSTLVLLLLLILIPITTIGVMAAPWLSVL